MIEGVGIDCGKDSDSELRRVLNPDPTYSAKSECTLPESALSIYRSLVNRMEQLELGLELLAQRFEVVREELLYEYQNRDLPTVFGAEELTEVPCSSAAFAWPSDGGLRLNLGCGHKPTDGFLNVDLRPLPGVDLVANIERLPLRAGCAQEILAAHVLEHFPKERIIRRILPHWRSVLQEGGTISVVVPNAIATIGLYSTGARSWKQVERVLMGAQDYSLDVHYSVFTPESLVEILIQSGFARAEVVSDARENGDCIECEVLAFA
jgi:predicted SAM-dependent methyltransferase